MRVSACACLCACACARVRVCVQQNAHVRCLCVVCAYVFTLFVITAVVFCVTISLQFFPNQQFPLVDLHMFNACYLKVNLNVYNEI